MSVTSLKREMDIIKKALNLNPKIVRYVQHLGGRPDEPHGPLHGQLVTFLISDGHSEMNVEPLTYEQEIELGHGREDYEDMLNKYPQMNAIPDHIYGTYEKWLQASACKCGNHGADGRQPCLGEKNPVPWVKTIQKEEAASNVEMMKPEPTPKPKYPEAHKPQPGEVAERVRPGNW